MKTEKEKLKESIDRKYEYYESMCERGICSEVRVVLEKQIQRMMDEYNLMQ